MRTVCIGIITLMVGLVGQSGCSDDTTAASPEAGVGDVAVADGPELYPNMPSGNPLVPEVAAYPFPSDFYLVDDAKTHTGRRVEIPQEALPAKLPGRAINGADGYSRITPILTFLPGGVDPKGLPPERKVRIGVIRE